MEKQTGCVHIYCGDGKGKTTCGMGLCTRAAGYGYRVLIYQFMKDNSTSERKVLLLSPNVTFVPGQDKIKFSFLMTPEEKAEQKRYYEEQFQKVTEKAVREEYDVLFLDELPEFRKNVLDGMRQPMEERKVQIARSAGMVTYPSDFILVAAMNPCPCGYYPDRNKCRCTQPQIEKYLGKISGPILDRIDLCVELHPVDILHLQKTKTEKSSEDMKRQIRHARERQAERFAGTDCRFNGDIRSAQVEEYCPLGEEGQKVMEQLYRTLQLSARVYHRILKTARTIADLEDREEITGEHLLEAACYRPSETYWN